MKILIVEDEHNSRMAMELFLSTLGHEVASAATATMARSLLEEKDWDLLICDWQLEHNRGEGVGIARMAQSGSSDTAVVFITGDSLQDLRAQTSDLDVLSYMAKPFGMSRLEQALKELD